MRRGGGGSLFRSAENGAGADEVPTEIHENAEERKAEESYEYGSYFSRHADSVLKRLPSSPSERRTRLRGLRRRGLGLLRWAADTWRNEEFFDAWFTEGNKRRVDSVENEISPQE